MSDKIPWPTTHAGLTPADIPYDYNAFPTMWDDDSGYEPHVVGSEVDDAGRTVIMVALSPGRVVPYTMVLAGQDVGTASKALLEALSAVRATSSNPGLLPPQRPAGAPDQGSSTREAV